MLFLIPLFIISYHLISQQVLMTQIPKYIPKSSTLVSACHHHVLSELLQRFFNAFLACSFSPFSQKNCTILCSKFSNQFLLSLEQNVSFSVILYSTSLQVDALVPGYVSELISYYSSLPLYLTYIGLLFLENS